MPISKINTGAIHDSAVTTAKVNDDAITTGKLDDSSGGVTTPGVEYLKVPVGSTAQRPSVPADGMLRFNTDFDKLEQYSSATSTWSAIDTPPSIISLSYPGSITAVDPAGGETITLTGTNFQSGAVVSIDDTDCVTSFVSSTSVTFVTPAKTVGDYDVVITNSNGLTATLTSGISYNGTPAFTSPAAGKIGNTLEPNTTIPTITIVASEPDGGTVAYSITSGSLPTGLSLNGSSGEITGTTPSPSAETTYPFTITATDDENQTSTRSYNLVVTRPVYNYSIDYALRIDGGDSFYQTLSSSYSSWTLSYWVKRTGNISNNGIEYLYSWGVGTGDGHGIFSDQWSGGTNSSWSVLHYSTSNASRGSEAQYNLRDQRWQHHVLSVNNGAMSLYVNGVLDETFAAANGTGTHNNLDDYLIFGRWHDGAYDFEGEFSEMHLVTGSALTASSFGSTYNNTWVPKEYTGSHGAEGWHLNFTNNSEYLTDQSSNGITFTKEGGAYVRTNSSPTDDVAILDFATSYAVNPSAYYYYGEMLGSYYNGGNYGHGYSNISIPESGKWYWEFQSQVQSGGGNLTVVGVVNMDKFRYNYAAANSNLYADGQFHGFIVNAYSSRYYTPVSGGSNTGEGQTTITFDDSSIFQIALDLDNGKMWLGKDGTWFNSGNPETGTNPSVTFSTGKLSDTRTRLNRYLPAVMTTRSSDQSNGQRLWLNFGSRDFSHTPPSGYTQISSANIPDYDNLNTVVDEQVEDYLGTTTYIGAGSGQTVNTTCQPDMVWIKEISNSSYGMRVFDPVKVDGSGNYLPNYFRDTTAFDFYGNSDSITPSTTSFTTGRVDAGGSGDASGGIDGSGNAHTAVYFKLGGAAVNNPDGNLSSTISANPTSGISAVRYTGNAQSGQTIGHGLGTKPDVAIIKDLTYGGYNWWVWSRYDAGESGGTGFYSGINSNDVGNSAAAYFPNLDPIFTSLSNSTVTLNNTGSYGNNNGYEFATYFFSEREGFSQFGYYESNNLDAGRGPVVRTGFEPEIVIIFDRGGSANWIMHTRKDNDRSGVTNRITNPRQYPIFLGLSNGESQETSRAVNFLSDGFQPNGNANDTNGSAGNKYFYMAFAAHPHKYKTGNG